MQTDFIGLENVSKAIELSKLTKFSISRMTDKGSYTPIFECCDSDQNDKAVEQFNEIAKLLNPFVQYKITLFDFAEITEDEYGQTKIKKGKNNTKKHFFTFILNNNAALNNNTKQQTDTNNMGYDVNLLRADIIKEIAKAQEDNLILKEIAELKNKLANFEEEEEEEEEKGLSGIDTNQINQIVGLINLFKPKQQNTTIAGTDEEENKPSNTDFNSNIKKAIGILYKHDKNLDTDLLKLANIAETSPNTFEMFVNMLRNS